MKVSGILLTTLYTSQIIFLQINDWIVFTTTELQCSAEKKKQLWMAFCGTQWHQMALNSFELLRNGIVLDSLKCKSHQVLASEETREVRAKLCHFQCRMV